MNLRFIHSLVQKPKGFFEKNAGAGRVRDFVRKN